jgi:hypothetical protein
MRLGKSTVLIDQVESPDGLVTNVTELHDNGPHLDIWVHHVLKPPGQPEVRKVFPMHRIQASPYEPPAAASVPRGVMAQFIADQGALALRLHEQGKVAEGRRARPVRSRR